MVTFIAVDSSRRRSLEPGHFRERDAILQVLFRPSLGLVERVRHDAELDVGQAARAIPDDPEQRARATFTTDVVARMLPWARPVVRARRPFHRPPELSAAHQRYCSSSTDSRWSANRSAARSRRIMSTASQAAAS